MSVKVSVIVPVYNAEPFLEACLESLAAQTLRECEWIFVDDGSTDGSGALLDRLQATDPRMRVVHQPNQGVSMARNKGLSLAAGEYIGFVDADDTVAPDLFERLYAAATEHGCDAVASNFVSEMGPHRVETRYPFPSGVPLNRAFIVDEVLPYFLKSDDFNTVCTKLFRAETIRAGGIEFPKNVALGEDGLFNMEFFSRARSLLYLDCSGYLYKERAGSATRNLKEKDYFGRAFEVYASDPPEAYKRFVSEAERRRLKAIRLIHTVLSLVHVYFAPSGDMGAWERYRQVRRAIRHPAVRESLPSYREERYAGLGAYQRLMFSLLGFRSAAGLYALALYSRIRNK